MQGKKSRRLILFTVLMIVIIFASFIIPRETKPSADTRVILEHTFKTYIAPQCFEDANATNFLEESTLGEAQKLNYASDSACTDEALKSEKNPFLISLLKEIGVLSTK
ncbi:hypothetical protein P9B03_05585 [Metasolibacillus meyeri]|uniref:Uncharacterized protein n=1 Tax=Metasolibacillus meyeri TaxID=1071052 RepID=A0AAW9NH41_9BACL|nr:hypothetical protein [Metasolibacillus meyeri]MEC1177949.1 hypothetical protein [Metasolibacillus meyeri]